MGLTASEWRDIADNLLRERHRALERVDVLEHRVMITARMAEHALESPAATLLRYQNTLTSIACSSRDTLNQENSDDV